MLVDEIRLLQGHRASLSLVDHSRVDEATVLGVIDDRVWLQSSGEDVFLDLDEVLDVWAPPAPGEARKPAPPEG